MGRRQASERRREPLPDASLGEGTPGVPTQAAVKWGDRLFWVGADRRTVRLLAEIGSPADLAVDREPGLVLVPLFWESEAAVYRLERGEPTTVMPLGAWVRLSQPSAVTTTVSSMRTPKRPWR